MMIPRWSFIFILGIIQPLSLLGAEPKRPQSMIGLSKVTVGPYDNFESYVSQDEKTLYYTQSQYMSSHIRQLDLETGISDAVLDLDGDSKNPRISPNGKLVAFTYYRNDAKGDVCFTPLKQRNIQCISLANITDHSPFWISDEVLAYLRSNDRGDQSELISYDIGKKQEEKILAGNIFLPNISADRQRLIYRTKDENMVLYDINQRKVLRQFQIAMPGLSGLAQFGPRGRYLYFTQYLVDTNRDLKIDGRDQGAIFRIDLEKKEGRLIPEQLTSSDQNCSYPFPGQTSLFVTCAFEGSLDIYRLPHHGIIPESWTAEDLWEAHLRSRSYADRLLLINRILTSYKSLTESEFQKRSLHNLVFLREWLIVHRYAKILKEQVSSDEKLELQSLEILANMIAQWEALPNRRVTAEFSRKIEEQSQQLQDQLKNAPKLISLVEAYFAFMLGRKDEALRRLDRPLLNLPIFLRYLYTDLWIQLHPQLEMQLKHFANLAQDPSLAFETRVYYLSALLEAVGQLKQPQKFLQAALPNWRSETLLKLLIENEIDLYTIANLDDTKELIKLGRGITKRVEALSEAYYAQRLLFNRNMIMFARYDKLTQLSNMASLWLSYTKRDSKEYPFVFEAYRQNTFDTAYSYLHNSNKIQLAKGAFFYNIRMSDDLESHDQIVRLNLAEQDWLDLEKDYQEMIKNELIRPSSLEFARLIRTINLKGRNLNDDEIEQGIQVVESLSDQQNGAGVKYLVLGYLYHQQLLNSQKNLTFERSFADQAHRHYLLALDLSSKNDRIRATALQNLGLLHWSIRNYSLAAEYFSRRNQYPFVSKEEELASRWIAANSQFKANRFGDALTQIELGLKLNPDSRAAWLERGALYAMNAGQYSKAVVYYDQYLQQGDKARQEKAGILLSYAFSLQELGRTPEALQWYQKAVEKSLLEKASEATKGLVSYQPLKIRFIAFGLMSQLKIANAERSRYLEARLKIYEELKANPSQYQFNGNDLLAQELKDRQRLAILYHELGQAAAARSNMSASLRLAVKEGQNMGYVSQAIQQSLKNAIYYFVWLDQKADSSEILANAENILNGMASEAKDQKNPSPQFVQMLTESRFFLAALKVKDKASDNRQALFEREVAVAKEDKIFTDLAQKAPSVHQNIIAYQKAMAAKL